MEMAISLALSRDGARFDIGIKDFDTTPLPLPFVTRRNSIHTYVECIAQAANVINPFARFTLVPSSYNTFTNGNLKDIFVSSERFRR